jgi:ABC-type nitrate/sulfonate/bicarbonate transport system permease component
MTAAVAVGGERGERRKVTLPRPVKHVLFAALVLVVWQVLALALGPLTLPSIPAVLDALVRVTRSGELGTALLQSISLLAIGLAGATVIGFFFGVLIGRSRLAQWTLSPYFSALFVTPTVALVPLVLVWFGFGLTGRVIVVILAALVPILLSVSSGLRDDPGELVEVARSFGVHGEWQLLRHVRLRAAVPVIMSGLRLATGRAVVGMAVAETYLRLGGMGGLIRGYGARFETDFVFATILPLSLLGILLTFGVGLVEKHYQGWRS